MCGARVESAGRESLWEKSQKALPLRPSILKGSFGGGGGKAGSKVGIIMLVKEGDGACLMNNGFGFGS